MTELYAKACLDARDIHATDVPAFIACMAENFAELIVQECARAADEGMAQVTMRVEWPSYHIKKHFGVTE